MIGLSNDNQSCLLLICNDNVKNPAMVAGIGYELPASSAFQPAERHYYLSLRRKFMV
jgi:hypothetical protein